MPSFGSRRAAAAPGATSSALAMASELDGEAVEGRARLRDLVARYLQGVYTQDGIAGVLAVMNRRMVSDLRMESLLNPTWLSAQQLLMVLLCCFVLLVAFDAARSGG